MSVVRTPPSSATSAPPPRGSVGLVPTMGAFHEGHLSLFRAAREENDLVVASLFVNPAQFVAGEDLARYPRDEDGDARAAPRRPGSTSSSRRRSRRCTRRASRPGSRSRSSAAILEGEHRPGHFRGVATVCLKLFNIVRPDRAYFGQKDAQQVAVLKRMIRDLDLDLEIRVCPTVRDEDGLALSSRNAYLSPEGARGRARPAAGARSANDPSAARRPRGRLLRGRRLRAARARGGRPRRRHPSDRQRRPRRRRPMSTPPKGKLPLPELAEMKRRGERIVMVTAYDARARASPTTPGSTSSSSATPPRWSCSATRARRFP